MLLAACRSSTPSAPVRVVDLIHELPHADQRPLGQFALGEHQVAGVSRPAIAAPVPSRLTIALPLPGVECFARSSHLERRRRGSCRPRCVSASASATPYLRGPLRTASCARPHVVRAPGRPVRLRRMEVELILSSGEDDLESCARHRRHRCSPDEPVLGLARDSSPIRRRRENIRPGGSGCAESTAGFPSVHEQQDDEDCRVARRQVGSCHQEAARGGEAIPGSRGMDATRGKARNRQFERHDPG